MSYAGGYQRTTDCISVNGQRFDESEIRLNMNNDRRHTSLNIWFLLKYGRFAQLHFYCEKQRVPCEYMQVINRCPNASHKEDIDDSSRMKLK